MTHNLRQASHDVEKISEDSAAPLAVAVKGPPLSTFLFTGTRALVAGLLTVVVLLFFLLVSGNSFLRRIVEILPRLRDKKQAVEIIYEIQRTVSTYLGTVTAMNAAAAVPMLATFKIVCDRVQALAAIGHFLGSEAREMQTAP
jgi:predicted PurR-regulated permease PerM